MLPFTYEQLELLLLSWFWPFMRISGYMMVCPIMGHNAINARVKALTAALLAALVAPLVVVPDIPITSLSTIGMLVEQLIIGVSVGMICRVIFAGVLAAGEFIAMQMGLGFAMFFSPDSGMNSVVVSRILNMIAMLVFISLNAHLFLIEIVLTSFKDIPVGAAINPDSYMTLAKYGISVFKTGFMIGLPLIGILLLINLAMGILNRSAPQLTIFSIGFPMTLLIGIVLLMFMMIGLGGVLENHFSEGIFFTRDYVKGMAQ